VNRILRFLWLLLRGVLISFAFLAALFGFVGATHWLLGDWAPLIVLAALAGGCLIALVSWIYSCWRASGKAHHG
jgi:hypothetical protein